MSEDLFYLKDVRSGKYHSMGGLTADKSSAGKYTELQLKSRLNVAKTHTKKFKEKLANGGLVTELVCEVKMGEIIIKSEYPYEDDDILYCDTEYYYDNGDMLRRNSIYSVYRNTLRRPKKEKGNLIKAILRVKSVSGKVIK